MVAAILDSTLAVAGLALALWAILLASAQRAKRGSVKWEGQQIALETLNESSMALTEAEVAIAELRELAHDPNLQGTGRQLEHRIEALIDRLTAEVESAKSAVDQAEAATRLPQPAEKRRWWDSAIAGAAVAGFFAVAVVVVPLIWREDSDPACEAYTAELRQLAAGYGFEPARLASIDTASLDRSFGALADDCGSSANYFGALDEIPPTPASAPPDTRPVVGSTD